MEEMVEGSSPEEKVEQDGGEDNDNVEAGGEEDLGSATGPIMVAKCGFREVSQRCHTPPQTCHTEVSPRPHQGRQRDLVRGVMEQSQRCHILR